MSKLVTIQLTQEQLNTLELGLKALMDYNRADPKITTMDLVGILHSNMELLDIIVQV